MLEWIQADGPGKCCVYRQESFSFVCDISYFCLIDDLLASSDWSVWSSVKVPIVVVSAPANPLANKRIVPLSSLSDEDFILMEESASYTAYFRRILAMNQVECKAFLHLQSADAARRLIERGRFLSVLPLYAVYNSLIEGKLSLLHIEELKQHQYVQLVLHKNKAVSPQVKGFLDEIQAAMHSSLAAKL